MGFGSSGASGVRSDIASIYKALREGKKTVKEANADLREYTASINTQTRAVAAMGKSYKAQYVVWFESARVMKDVGYIGRSLLSVYQAHTLHQIRLGNATRNVTEIERELARVTEEYTRIVHDLGPESIYAQQRMTEMTYLTTQHTRAVEGLSNAQRDSNLMWASTVMTLTGTVSNLSYMAQHLSTLRNLLSDSTLRAATLASTFTTLATAITLAGAALIGYGVAYALTTPGDVLAQKTYENLLGSGGYGMSNLGGGWGFTQEGLEGDLPRDSDLYKLYSGKTPMDTSLIEKHIAPHSEYGFSEERQRREDRSISFTQNVAIRTADDKTTVNKVADASMELITRAVMR